MADPAKRLVVGIRLLNDMILNSKIKKNNTEGGRPRESVLDHVDSLSNKSKWNPLLLVGVIYFLYYWLKEKTNDEIIEKEPSKSRCD